MVNATFSPVFFLTSSISRQAVASLAFKWPLALAHYLHYYTKAKTDAGISVLHYNILIIILPLVIFSFSFVSG